VALVRTDVSEERIASIINATKIREVGTALAVICNLITLLEIFMRSVFPLLVTANFVRFEVFTAVTMKNGVFWVVTPCGSCKNRRFGGTWPLLHQGDKNR
jgi:hypothetical protein